MPCKSRKPIRGWQPTTVIAVLVLHAGMLAWGSARHSPVWSEPDHLVAGVSHWQFGTFYLKKVNPPLVRLVAAIPVMFTDVKTDWSGYSEAPGVRSECIVSRDLIDSNGGARMFQLHTLARWACIPFSLLGGFVCYVWARSLYGPLSGLLALVLWCASPTIIAHGQVITADVGAAALGVTAAYCFWCWLREGSWSSALAAGVTLGLAELAKTTWIVLFGLWPLLWLVWCVGSMRASRDRCLRPKLVQLAGVLVLAVLVLNMGYGFEGSCKRLGDYTFFSKTLKGQGENLDDAAQGGNRFRGSRLGSIVVPFPENYVAGIDLQKVDFEQKMWSYLRGEWVEGGWWYYYLYALAVKVPLGTWLLGILALAVPLFMRGYTTSWRDELLVLAPAVAVLVFVSSQTGFNQHPRYVIPALPFVFIGISRVARAVELRHVGVAAAATAAMSWTVAASLWAYPHSLAYFNEFAGGAIHGHEHLLHSSIDWDQDLLYLKRWLAKHPEARPLRFTPCSTCLDPKIAGIECEPLLSAVPSDTMQRQAPQAMPPLPGWHAISVGNLRDYNRRFAYLLRFKPRAMAGYSIYIYHITREDANRVRRGRRSLEW